MIARLRRRWVLWRRRATRRDRRWQHYGARCWYGHRLLLRRALTEASVARVENHQRILDAFAAARNAEARAMVHSWPR